MGRCTEALADLRNWALGRDDTWFTHFVLFLHAVAVAWAAFTGWQRPMGNWDIVPYAALVRSQTSVSAESLSQLTYNDVRQYVDEQKFEAIIGGDYQRAVYTQPAALIDTLKLYAIKPLYVHVSRLAFFITGNAASAVVLVSAAAFAVAAILVPLCVHSSLLAVTAIWLLLFIGDPSFSLLASAATPDTLSLLFMIACAITALKGHHAVWVGSLGLLAVLARPDAAFVAVPLLLGLTYLRRGGGAVPFLVGAGSTFALFIYLGSQALPWSALFSHTFLAREAFPSSIGDSVTVYDYAYILGQTYHAMLKPRPLFFLVAGGALALGPWLRSRRFAEPQLLATVSAINMVLHYLIFPIDEFGHERMFLASYVLTMLAGLKVIDKASSAHAS